jgi:hypothetical protein
MSCIDYIKEKKLLCCITTSGAISGISATTFGLILTTSGLFVAGISMISGGICAYCSSSLMCYYDQMDYYEELGEISNMVEGEISNMVEGEISNMVEGEISNMVE